MPMADGLSRSSRASLLVMIVSPSISRFGSPRGRAPVAIRMLLAVSGGPPSTSTIVELLSTPLPRNKAMLFFRSRNAIPRVRVADTLRLRSTALPMSALKLSNERPQSPGLFNWLTNSAFFRRDFEGIQPQLRQTPPSPPMPLPSSFSTTAVRRPSCAARMAAW